MGEQKKPRWFLWTATVLIVLPAVYVLSVGPAVWAWEHGWASTETILGGWDPVFALGRGRLFGPAVKWYVQLWSEWGLLYIAPPEPPAFHSP